MTGSAKQSRDSTTATVDCFVARAPRNDEQLPDHRRSLIGHRDIEHAQLHALRALISVDAERSRHVQRLAAMGHERIAELLPDRAEGYAVDDCAVARFKAHA